MNLPEQVSKLTVKSLKSYYVEFDNSKVRTGHDFCELIVDEDNNRFTARLYNGETYTYSWSAPNSIFTVYLVDIFEKYNEYLYDKLCDVTAHNNVEVEKTVDKMRKILLESRRQNSIDEDDARDIWIELDYLHGEEDMPDHFFYDAYARHLEKGIEKGVFSDEPYFEEFVTFGIDYKCDHFCQKIAPILAQVLRSQNSDLFKEETVQ